MYSKEVRILSGILQTMDTDFICDRLKKTDWCEKCEERDITECFLRYGLVPQRRCYVPVSRQVFQAIWAQYMEDAGNNPDTDFENDTFCVRSYDWSGEREEDWNFWHKPSGFKLEWYKYPMRSAEMNMFIFPEQFVDILKDCRNSMESGKVRISYECKKWWQNE